MVFMITILHYGGGLHLKSGNGNIGGGMYLSSPSVTITQFFH